MAVEKMSVSLLPKVADQIERRLPGKDANRSFVVGRQLERYFDLLEWYKRDLRRQFNVAEISLITDVLNGTAFMDTSSIRYMGHEVADALIMDVGLAEKWKVNGPALVAKIETLSFAQSMALVDAVEIWWNRVGSGEQPDISEVL